IDLTTAGGVITAAASGTLDLNDIRLSNYPSGNLGGNVVAAGGSETTNSQTGQALTGTFSLASYDANGDAVFSPDDVLYAVPGARTGNQALKDGLVGTHEPDGNNKLAWPTQGGVAGYQVWSHNSPWALVITVDAGTNTLVQKGPASTHYLVTAFTSDATKLTD